MINTDIKMKFADDTVLKRQKIPDKTNEFTAELKFFTSFQSGKQIFLALSHEPYI